MNHPHPTDDPSRESQYVELFAFPTSPYAMKVGCYLAYKGLDYQLVGVSPISFRQVDFTGKRQVPVLRIADEWKLESQEIGIWLEDRFPGNFLLGTNETERAEILSLDNWVSHQLIPAMFRIVVDWPSVAVGFGNGWKLARAVNESTPIPLWVRFMWPLFLRKAKFIVSMMDSLDRSESLPRSQEKLIHDFEKRLDGGPFLGGREQISLADLSAFPIIVFPYRFGLNGDANWFENSHIVNWISAVQGHLPENPFLVESRQMPRELPALNAGLQKQAVHG